MTDDQKRPLGVRELSSIEPWCTPWDEPWNAHDGTPEGRQLAAEWAERKAGEKS